MPRDEAQVPSTLKKSADKIERAYTETLESAEEQDDGDEARAHRTAWASVKNIAERKGDHWELKDETGPSDPRSKHPAEQKRQGKGETFGGIDVEANTRDQLVERAKKAGVTGYSHLNKSELARQLQRKEHD